MRDSLSRREVLGGIGLGMLGLSAAPIARAAEPLRVGGLPVT
jgi:hypothetical protein